MYTKFFGLSQDPFSISPDPRYLYMSERHREALAHLLYGLKGGGGFVMLSGEVGTGKTTVCRCFLEQINSDCNVAYIFNPKLTSSELLRSICEEFHIDLPSNAVTAKDFIDPLNKFLLREHSAGKNNILIIDEAQNLSVDVLEQLRLLTNLETNERKLLQIVLIGQSELRQMLARPELAQLAQRVIARFHLEALSLEETRHYIAHRLSVAGMSGSLPFERKALVQIHKLSMGVPRRINLLCGGALLGAYTQASALVDKRTVDKAAVEIFGPDLKKRGFSTPLSALGLTSHGRFGFVASIALASFTGLLLGAALLAMIKRLENSTALQQTSQTKVKTPVIPGSDGNSVSQAAQSIGESLTSKSDLYTRLALKPLSYNQAWQELGKAWGLTLNVHDACRAALEKRVYCFNSKKTSLNLIRNLNRPVIIFINDNNKRNTYAVLSVLTLKTAQLNVGDQIVLVPLPLLAEVWQGGFSTLLLVPETITENPDAGKSWSNSDWLATQLVRIQGTAGDSYLASLHSTSARDTVVRDRVYAFQQAHGLVPDGKAGPMTIMQLNRVMGVVEPRLTTDKL